jgi:DNA-binding Lrp family transcriptional regulator
LSTLRWIASLDAARLGLTLSLVYERIRCLEQLGFIKQYVGSWDEYRKFVRNKLSKIENIGRLNSTFSLKVIKHSWSYTVK